MLKNDIKNFIVSCYPLSKYLTFLTKFGKKPFLCIITPIFDEALPSAKLLIKDLQIQSCNNFIQVFVSNGASPETKSYIEKLRQKDKRFFYTEITEEKITDGKILLANLGKRRNHAFNNFEALRYVFIDADSEIIDKDYIAKLFIAHIFTGKDIIVTRIQYQSWYLPIFPMGPGHIDITNFTFSGKISKKYPYPTNWSKTFGPANDYRYFLKINKGNNTLFLDFVGIKKDSRRCYKSVGEFYIETISN